VRPNKEVRKGRRNAQAPITIYPRLRKPELEILSSKADRGKREAASS